MNSFELSDLPQTIEDGVKIARHLHIRYIWIDCLCICQDDPEDWARESARMADIYSNAHIVIAAGRASNASKGCFHIRAERASRVVDFPGYSDQVTISLLDNSSEMDSDRGRWPSEPLSSRGWAFQERLLSPRTIHFTTTQMYYECNHGILGEDGCRVPGRYGAVDAYSGEDQAEIGQSSGHWMESWIDLNMWNYLVMEYTMRSLTKPTDRLPALGGVAKMFEDHFGVEYVAGLWSSTLLRDLTWTPFPWTGYPASPADCYTGPSWSWSGYAGVTPGPASTQGAGVHYPAEILRWQTSLKSEANPYGEVDSAWICLRAPMTALIPEGEEIRTLAREKWPNIPGRQQTSKLRTAYREDDLNCSPVCLDYGDMRWENFEMKVLLLEGVRENKAVDSEDTSGEDVDDEDFFGLVVTSTSGSNFKTVKRVGYLNLKREEARAMTSDEGNRCVVTLV